MDINKLLQQNIPAYHEPLPECAEFDGTAEIVDFTMNKELTISIEMFVDKYSVKDRWGRKFYTGENETRLLTILLNILQKNGADLTKVKEALDAKPDQNPVIALILQIETQLIGKKKVTVPIRVSRAKPYREFIYYPKGLENN